MIGGDGRFERSEHVDLARAADFEDGAAAIADIKIFLAVESDSGCDAHALDEYRHIAAARDLIHNPVVTAGDIEDSLAVKCQPGGIHQIGNEWLRIVIC